MDNKTVAHKLSNIKVRKCQSAIKVTFCCHMNPTSQRLLSNEPTTQLPGIARKTTDAPAPNAFAFAFAVSRRRIGPTP